MSKGLDAATGVPIIGQPFTIVSVYVPVNITLTCNCAGSDHAPMHIVMSQAVVCPHCTKSYNAVQEPGQVKMQVTLPKAEPVMP